MATERKSNSLAPPPKEIKKTSENNAQQRESNGNVTLQNSTKQMNDDSKHFLAL